MSAPRGALDQLPEPQSNKYLEKGKGRVKGQEGRVDTFTEGHLDGHSRNSLQKKGKERSKWFLRWLKKEKKEWGNIL